MKCHPDSMKYCALCINERIFKVSNEWYQNERNSEMNYNPYSYTGRTQVISISIPVTTYTVFSVGDKVKNPYGDKGVIVRLYNDNTADIVFGNSNSVTTNYSLDGLTVI